MAVNKFIKRRYESGSKWAFFRWVDIHFNGTLYLRRFYIAHTPLGGIMIHWFHHPDPQRDLHDHPVNFWSFVVRGGYAEERGPSAQLRFHTAPAINKVRATDLHRIVALLDRTVTVVLYGSKQRDWGFHTDNGWVPWREYEKLGDKT